MSEVSLEMIQAMLANLRREIAVDAVGVAHLSSRVDRLAEEIGRIKRRLDIGDA